MVPTFGKQILLLGDLYKSFILILKHDYKPVSPLLVQKLSLFSNEVPNKEIIELKELTNLLYWAKLGAELINLTLKEI